MALLNNASDSKISHSGPCPQKKDIWLIYDEVIAGFLWILVPLA